MRLVKSQVLSLAVHAATALLLLWVGTRIARPVLNRAALDRHSITLRVPILQRASAAGGANVGDQPTRVGPPPLSSLKAFVPRETKPDPKLPMLVTVAFETPPLALDSQPIGDPYGQANGSTLGRHGKDGIGDGGCCGGTGPERGGMPGISGGPYRRPTIPAALIYKVEPEFSEEARKAKYQGEVVLSIEVGVDGTARVLRVVSGPGLGLAEKAVEAVRRWRFKPAYLDGKPVASMALVEVHFHLL